MNKSMMKQALMDDGFVRYFERTSGIQILSPLMTRDQVIERYTATDVEWLAMTHRFMPKPLQVHGREAFEAKMEELLQTMSPAEILMMGEPQPEEQVRAQLKVRNYQNEKLWRYYVAYLHNLPPQHPDAAKLHKRYPRPWHDTGLLHRQNQGLAA